MQRGLGFGTKITNNTAKTKNLISTTAVLTAVATKTTNGGRRIGGDLERNDNVIP
jgi:hypothetical protein